MITLNELNELDDAAFNRAVAEAAGWTEISEGLSMTDFGYLKAWLGKCHPGEWWKLIPNYATDLNVAWGLCSTARVFEGAEIYLNDGAFGGTVVASGGLHIARAHNPARALATAWYAWKLEQEAH